MTYPLDIAQQGKDWIPRIIVSDQQSIHAIQISEVMYLEAKGSYTRIITSRIDILSSRPLSEYQNQLGVLPFFRCHHSYLVNLNYMMRYDKACRYLQLENGEKVPVSFRKKEALVKVLYQNNQVRPVPVIQSSSLV